MHLFDMAGQVRGAPEVHDGLWQLSWHRDGRVLMSASHDVFLHRGSDGATLQLRVVESGAGIAGMAHTAEGIFITLSSAFPAIRFRKGTSIADAEMLTGEQVAKRMYRPNLMRAFWNDDALESGLKEIERA